MSTDEARGDALKVLVVDDYESQRTSEALIVALEGYETATAPDGPTALRKVRAWQPDIVLLDLGLPGIDGYEVAREIHAMHLATRPLLVAVTGYAREVDKRRSREAGIDLHLVKPVDPEQLCDLLRRFYRALGGSAPRPGPEAAGAGTPSAPATSGGTAAC